MKAKRMWKEFIRVLAIDLRICLFIATVSDFKDGWQKDDVERKEPDPVIAPERKIRTGSGVEKVPTKEVPVSKVRPDQRRIELGESEGIA